MFPSAQTSTLLTLGPDPRCKVCGHRLRIDPFCDILVLVTSGSRGQGGTDAQVRTREEDSRRQAERRGL